MKETHEQVWYKAESRRNSLLKRRHIYALHAIAVAKEPAVISKQENLVEYFTLDGKYSVMLPTAIINELPITRGGVYHVKELLHPDELLTGIETAYLVVHINNCSYGLDLGQEKGTISLVCFGDKNSEPFNFKDFLIVNPGDIANYSTDNKERFVTTYGRYFVNQFLIASVFSKAGTLPELKFRNDTWSIKKFEKVLGQLLLNKKVTVDECNKYIDHGYFISGFGELCGATMTRKGLIPDDNLIKTRNALFEKYKYALDDPRIMIIIDNELIEQDKANLRNDPSMDFFGARSKTFTVDRKNQNSAVGMVSRFGNEKGQYNYIKNSLYEGLKPEYFALQMDESRRGFYDRAVETQVAGVDTKFVVNTFQSTRICEDDCGTKRHLTITIHGDVATSYLGRYVEVERGKYELITPENIKSFIGKEIKLRSPMYCESKDGYCVMCCGKYFKDLGYRNPATLMMDITRVFTTMAMKSMHGKKVDSMTLSSLDEYILNL